jgi:hypothetical protein
MSRATREHAGQHNLLSAYPALAEEWHPSKNINLRPEDIAPYSTKKVWWICGKGHVWKARIANRSRGRGCPYCAGRLVCDDNCLQTLNPALASQWHPRENGALTPRDVTPGSIRKVWWVCGKGHEWEATVASRSHGNGCPYCAGRLICDDNCLQTLNPDLASQWHPMKNDALIPRDVTLSSNKKVWWVCGKGHEWEARVANRSRGRGCPYCAGRLVCDDNCLQTLNPALASQWHPRKNGALTPRDVTPGSIRRVWWICGKGHEWEATVNNRSSGTGCPYCARYQ